MHSNKATTHLVTHTSKYLAAMHPSSICTAIFKLNLNLQKFVEKKKVDN